MNSSSSTLDVGRRLVDLCRQGKNLEAVETLYAPDVVSLEVHGDETMPARMQGVDAVRRKNQWWLENHTFHGGDTNGPFPHGDRFIVHFKYDVTPKVGPMAGNRMQMEEAGLYTVRDGKVVQEEFFYHMG
jgi:ketosteroid isomerase-like protein